MPADVWLAVAGVAFGISIHPDVSGRSIAAAFVCGLGALHLRRSTPVAVVATVVLAAVAGWTAAALEDVAGIELRASARSFPRCHVGGRILEQAGGLGTLIAIDESDCSQVRNASVIVSTVDLPAGQRVTADGWLSPLGEDRFDRARARTGADAEFVVDEIEAHGVDGLAQRAAHAFRDSLRDVADHLPSERSGLILGMAIGDTSQLPEPLLEQLRRAGLTHLLAVSGSNVALVMGVVALSLRRSSLAARVAASAVALAFYVLVVGPEPSVVRAGAMGAIALVALWRGAETQTLNLLGLALVGVLLLRPGMLYAPGLHLSAAATAGIVLWAARLAERFTKLPRPAALALAATLAAQFAVSPVLLATFGEISLVAPLANVLAFPMVAPITIVGLAAGAIALVAPAPARVLMSAISPLAEWVVDVGRVTGSARWAAAAIPAWSAAPAAAAVVLAAVRTLRAARPAPEPVPRDDGLMGDWIWRLNAANGKELRATHAFDSKEDAEAWLGGEWQSLAGEGAESVTLVQGDTVVYTMGLGEE